MDTARALLASRFLVTACYGFNGGASPCRARIHRHSFLWTKRKYFVGRRPVVGQMSLDCRLPFGHFGIASEEDRNPKLKGKFSRN
jgi:hypothetical protein